ncbi:hypothetical protein SASPL_114402 [Salvia splendens]|uniref:WAT1-related protein n=1 Tax=Salvia splendens TaxID=180675 RepID=A0A8X8Y600_SALSN|nr:hypothetical protein SASPL_114402 [Salvia splendens]
MSALVSFKPHMLMVLSQIGYTVMYIIAEASFNHGMDPSVYVTYRHIVATLVMLPFAYFMERLEVVNIRSPRGIAKILGTGVSLAGVMTTTLYKGGSLRKIGDALIHINGSTSVVDENWLKGSLLVVASCITWSIWYIMQAYTLKRYPAQLSLTTWMNAVGAAQSALYTAVVQHERSAWTIGFDIDLWSTLYGVRLYYFANYSPITFSSVMEQGVVISGVVTYVQLWCMEAKGPVFVTLFNPLSTLLVALLSYFVLGENLYVGSIIGGGVVVIGLYLLLWGKQHDESQRKETEDSKAPIFSQEEINFKGEA